MGGNIANGSPIGDSPPPLIALGATLVLRCGGRRREMPLEDYFIAYGKQDRRPGEFVGADPPAAAATRLAVPLLQDLQALRPGHHAPRSAPSTSGSPTAASRDIRICIRRHGGDAEARPACEAAAQGQAVDARDRRPRAAWRCGATTRRITDMRASQGLSQPRGREPAC